MKEPWCISRQINEFHTLHNNITISDTFIRLLYVCQLLVILLNVQMLNSNVFICIYICMTENNLLEATFCWQSCIVVKIMQNVLYYDIVAWQVSLLFYNHLWYPSQIKLICDMRGWFQFPISHTVYPKKCAHGFVVLCFVVVMQSFIMNTHEVFIHIHQSCFAGTGAIVRLPQCQWSKPDGYGKISQCITTTRHSKVKTVCIFLRIYCISFGTSYLNLL